MRYLLFLLMYDFILIKGNKVKPSSYVYLARIAYNECYALKENLLRKRKQELTRFLINLLISYKKKKKKNKQTNKTKQIYLTYPTLKERKKAYRRSFRKLTI